MAKSRRRFRRGSALPYVVLCLPTMVLLASLAVDLGRAQTDKSALQAAADAAARAAAMDLVNAKGNAVASADAISAAKANLVDGQPLALQSSDVVFGTWDPVARAFMANTSTTNAVEITAYRTAARNTAVPTLFAAVEGSPSVNIHVVSIAYVTHGLACFNAQGNVTFNETGIANGGTWQTDSYLANNGAYSSVSAGEAGDLAANGSVSYNFVTPANGQPGTANMINSYVNGQIYTANGADCTYNWSENGTTPGTYWIQYGATDDPGPSTTEMSSPQTFTTPVMPKNNTNPAIPSGYLSGSTNGLQDLSVADGSRVVLPGGIYTLNSLSISNGSTIAFSGPVTLNIATNITINGAAIEGEVDDPKYMKINVCNTTPAGTNNVSITDPTHGVYADLNAPLANVSYSNPNGGNDFYGRIYGNNLNVTCTGNGNWHADQSLNTAFHMVK